MGLLKSLAALVAAVAPIEAAYDWKNVRIGGGGGFIPSVVFHPNVSGLAYARTDIGGVYRMNSDQTWTPITDSIAFNASWHNWGCDALAVDPQNEDKVYAAVGMYTNDWDPNNGAIIRSADKGETWEFTNLTFKVGGNMPGRGMGERLAVDPANSDIIYFGARSGKGLWKSTDGGKTFANVTSFTDTGPFAPNPKDPNDYENDPQGLTFVTFDSTSATIDGATSRIFVGTADNSTSGASVWQTKDAGKTWTAVPNQPKKYFPHKCRLSPTEQAMYLSYSDGTGPYDGTMGGVHRYDLKNSSWTDITPVSGSNLYFGFGGLSVDIKNPGTVMVAALNSWWPDAQIFRSNDSGATWSQLWEWESYPTRSLYYGSNYTAAPWIGEFLADDTKKLGWMIESLEIDPHDSDHWVYGTGLTMFGGNDLTKWDTVHNITIDVMATGIEEMAVLGLASVPNGTELLAAVGDDSGFTFASSSDLGTSPNTMWGTPTFTSSTGVDYAGTTPKTIVRIGNSAGTPQVAMSNDGGVKWYKNYAAGTKAEGGSVALSADATSIVWSTANNGVMHSTNSASFSAVSSLPSAAVIASDKRSAKYFYAGSGSNFYVSSDGGATFAKSGASSLTGVGGIRAIAVHPSTGGNVYVSTDIGVFASKDFGKTFSALGKGVISNAYAISLGKGSTGTNIYVLADGSAGAKLYASADGGSTWADIQGDKQGFASLPSCVLAGSNNVADQVYVGTNGRGVMYASGSVSSGTAATTGSVVGSSAAAAATGTYSNSTTSAVTASASVADVASSTEAASTEAASTEAASAAAWSSSTTAAASAAETSSSDDDSCSADSGDSTWASATTTAASATETGSDDDSCDSDDGDATSTASAAAASETGSDDDSCDSDDGDATSTASAAAASETGSDDDSCDSDDGDATSTASAAAASETGSDDDSCDSDDGDATSTTSTAATATATGSDDDDSCSADDSSKTAVAVSAADVSTATSSAASSSATDSGSDSDDDDSCSSDDGDDDDSSSADASSATSTGEASAAATSAAATSAAATSAAATSAATSTSSSSAAAAATSSASSSSGSSSSGSSSGTAAEYGQCGGKNWKGATTCATGFTCKVMNPYYSQCV